MANFINIGTLDTLVTLRSCVISKNREGSKKYTFQDFRNVYAQVDRQVNEQVNAGNLEEGDYINVTIYKVPELTTRWQVVVNGTSYEITGINPIDRISPFCVLSLHSID